MKILRVIWSMDPKEGGPCQGIRNSVPELAKLGVYNEVVSLDLPDSKFIAGESFTIHAVGPRSGPWSYNAKLKPWLLENLQRFDAVIVHGLWQYHSYATMKALSQLKKQNPAISIPKLYVMPHGMLDPWFQKAKGRKLKAIRNWVFWKLVEGKVVNHADGVLFTCNAELKLARETFRPYHPLREINVSYGIKSPPSFSDSMRHSFLSACPDVKEFPYFLFLSRINYKKGVDILIQAYSIVLQECMARNKTLPKLVIAGPGIDSGYGLPLHKLVSENTLLSQHIFFPGMLSGAVKWGAFYGCEAFILPSHQENFGIAVVEALACSKPVLISNQVNIWTEIEEANAGIIEEDTLNGIVNMLKKWMELSEAGKEKMGRSAKNVFNTQFAIEPAALQFLKGIQQ
ncbi:glycosyltransferase [Dyadobacter sediminis]|uniref:Glycosyltransferase n=1 Tax=Dyadobacter sediminis TaxID=1493691 RepID=A0A5R9KDW5_9BACT|nr:glycosyltransferase [Dyadobacter sediminis]TLU94283.1 glycosyltransferase [Dyadobacter sediminis]GGB92621.1 glycosyl transferase family 1 [Dyadobacter sediminis]